MDKSSNQAIRDLGVFYCAVYALSMAASALALWLYWDAWSLDSLMTVLAKMITVSAGVALSAAILKEAVWYMVLAGMKIRQLREEGREQGRESQRKREEAAYARFGFEVNGVLVLPRTPEVERFLAGEDESEEGR